MKIPKPQHDDDFDTMVDIGAALRKEAKHKEIMEKQEQLRKERETELADEE